MCPSVRQKGSELSLRFALRLKTFWTKRELRNCFAVMTPQSFFLQAFFNSLFWSLAILISLPLFIYLSPLFCCGSYESWWLSRVCVWVIVAATKSIWLVVSTEIPLSQATRRPNVGPNYCKRLWLEGVLSFDETTNSWLRVTIICMLERSGSV